MRRCPLARMYTALLRLYPAEHRQAWGTPMQITFDMRIHEIHDAGLVARVRFAAKEFWSVISTATDERLSQRSGNASSGAPRSFGPSPRSPRRDIVNQTLSDLRVAWRASRREPATALVVVLTLALGIGATTAIFSVVDGVLLRPLPFPEADRLVALTELLPDGGTWTLSMPDFVDYRDGTTSLDEVVIYEPASVTLSGDGAAERIPALLTTDGFFEMLGLSVPIGRGFTREDEAEDAPLIVILGHAFWLSRYAGDRDVLGTTLRIEGEERTVIGVAPPNITFSGDEPDVFLPFSITQGGLENRGGHMYEAIARLAVGTELGTARQEVALIADRIAGEYPDSHEGQGATLVPLDESILGDVDRPLFLLLGAVGMLLLIACANVAAIMLARAESRDREVAVRTALGASTGRLVRQLLTDAILLASAGGLLGVLLAYACVQWIVTHLAANLPRIHHVAVDPRVLGFALVVTVGTGMLVGIFPALRVFRTDIYGAMRSAASTGPATAHTISLRRGLVVAEIGLAVVLVLGASLLVQSLHRLQGVQSGFVAEDALTFRIGLPTSRYATRAAANDFIQRLEQEIGRLPGVDAVGAVGLLPFFASQNTSINVPGGDPDAAVDGVQFRYATAGYFDAIGTPLLRGRLFDSRDVPESTPVIIVSQTLARELVGDDDPIGREITTGWASHPEAMQIVGVVEDVRLTGLERTPPPAMYWPFGQWDWRSSMSFVVRTRDEPTPLIASIRQTVTRLDAELPIYQVEMLADRTRRSVGQERLTTWLLAAFAVLALALGAVGIFGVMGYSVVRRRREIGVRVALGASPGVVTRHVLSEGAALAATGVALGSLGALSFRRLLAALLYETSATDPTTFVAVAVLLIGVALLSCYLPGRRAARMDPVTVLRAE